MRMQAVPHQGRQIRGAVISCGHCGATKTLPINRIADSTPRDQEKLEEQFAKKKFAAMGWLVGKKDTAHRCPGCYSAIKSRQAVKNSTNRENVVTLHPNPEPASAKSSAIGQTAREMLREDRGIILAKLVEVYGDEKTGYGDGWTDKKVSEHLGVPRAWVAKLREENFGPEGNEEIRAVVAEAEKLLAEMRDIAGAIEVHGARFNALRTKAEQIEKSLLQIRKDLR